MAWLDRLIAVRDASDADLPAGVRHLLLVLATYADDEGRCFPSLDTLATKMGTTRNTARARTRAAVDLGWLVIEHPGKWKGDPTRYRMAPKGVNGEPLTASQRGRLTTAKGSIDAPKGVNGEPRTSNDVQERAVGARSENAASAPDLSMATRVCDGCRREFFGDGYSTPTTPICSRKCEQTLKGAAA